MVGSDTSPGALSAQDFGPYTIVRRLGVGGMAETFEAIRRGRSGFSQRVCLKLVRPAFREDAASIELFEREARLAAKLHHSNIVGVIDFGDIEGTLYMALELVDGVDLRRLLDTRTRLSPDYVTLLGHDVAAALDHAHNPTAETGNDGLSTGGILHRDISPANVLISHYGEIKLTDFGLANVAAEGSRQSAVKGKFPYMSPERLRDESLDARSDLFSLGVVLFEALAGRRPYEGGHDPATIMLIIEGDHPPLCELALGTPPRLCQIIESLIEPEREKRPRSAVALIEQLDEFVPQPDARRKLGKIVVATRGPSVPPAPPDEAAAKALSRGPAGIPGSSSRWSRRDVNKMTVWFFLTAGGAAAAWALWPRRDSGTQPYDVADVASEAGSPGETEASGGTDEATETVPSQPAETNGKSTEADPREASEAVAPPPVTRPASARLTVLVSPWGRVWINGKPQGVAPLKNKVLKPGRYRISAGQDGPSQSRNIVLREGARNTIRFDLAK